MKIFGIGLSKTGTTSLTRALEILGYSAIHNPSYLLSLSDEGLKLDYQEVDRFDALTDIQIARFYKELDLRYPDSKFILTTRKMEGWLGSCQNHFNDYRNSSAKAKALHLDVYGTDSYDERKLRSAYKRHYDEVVEYFLNRENDFLVLDVSDKGKWEKLCGFLGKSVPDEPYPVKNKAIPVPVIIKNVVRRFGAGRRFIKAVKRKLDPPHE